MFVFCETLYYNNTIKKHIRRCEIRQKEEVFFMRKTTSYSSTFSDALSVDTAGLQKMLNSGRQTATQIGMAAGARFCVGRRVYWNVAKIRKYLDEISE